MWMKIYTLVRVYFTLTLNYIIVKGKQTDGATET